MRRVMWSFAFKRCAEREFCHLPHDVQARIASQMREWASMSHPLAHAEPLSGLLKGLWRLRVGDYRLIVEPFHAQRRITVLRIAHRREVYR